MVSRETAASLLQVAVTHDSRKMRWDFSKPRELRNMIDDLEHQLGMGPYGANKDAVRLVVDSFVRSLGRDKQKHLPNYPEGFTYDEWRQISAEYQQVLKRFTDSFDSSVDSVLDKFLNTRE